MQIKSHTAGATQVVSPAAHRIDAAVAIQFKDSMREAVAPGVDRLVLDLREVEFIDSSGLGAIVAVMKEHSSSVRLDLASLQPSVEKVFSLTRMDTIFKIFPTAEDAVAHGSD